MRTLPQGVRATAAYIWQRALTNILALSPRSANIHRHFPFPLPSVTQRTLGQLPPLLSPPISQTQGQLSWPVALDVEALTQHGHLCLSREINTRQGQRRRARRGSVLSRPVLSLLILSQITPHVCRRGNREELQIEYVWQADL